MTHSDYGISEWERRNTVNKKRLATPCYFKDGLSYEEFDAIAQRVGKKIHRITGVVTDGAIIHCEVESQTGYSSWNFRVDFNNWGHVTGTCWKYTDNTDSNIPDHYGQMVSEEIQDFLTMHSITLEDYSDYVDANTDLGTPAGMGFHEKRGIISRLFSKGTPTVSVPDDSYELRNEHLYPVISKLKAWGFRNIKAIPINDINSSSINYLFEVEHVYIGGTESFKRGNTFIDNTEVIIQYHDKQYIVMPFSERDLKRMDYVSAGDRLVEKGYSQIYERKIEDLITGWIVKDGSVEKVLIDGNDDTPIKKGTAYLYDTEIVICYHTYKKK